MTTKITAAERARNRKAYSLLDRSRAAIAQGEVDMARHILTRDWVALWGPGPIPRPIAEYHGRLWQMLPKPPAGSRAS